MANEHDIRKIYISMYIPYETVIKIRKKFGSGVRHRCVYIEKALESSVKDVMLTASELRDVKKFVEDQYEKRMKIREIDAARRESVNVRKGGVTRG